MSKPDTTPAAATEPLRTLASLVVKQGLALGGLGEATRAQVLGFVWAGLPRAALSEPGLNAALKLQLAGAVRCLGTDHVELRRWLCDIGWLRRDAWGREYRRVAPAELPPPQRALGTALEAAFDDGATAAWAEAQRAAHEAMRRARRLAHDAAAASAP
jgi:hypothetical protein